jgi:hypothetical protein
MEQKGGVSLMNIKNVIWGLDSDVKLAIESSEGSTNRTIFIRIGEWKKKFFSNKPEWVETSIAINRSELIKALEIIEQHSAKEIIK